MVTWLNSVLDILMKIIDIWPLKWYRLQTVNLYWYCLSGLEVTSWIEGFIPFESTVNQAGLLFSLKIMASQGGFTPSHSYRLSSLCPPRGGQRILFLKWWKQKQQSRIMISWTRCLHMGAGPGPLGRDLPCAAGREILLIPVSLDSWADLRPAHVTLYCDILLHHWPSLGFHNTL